MIYIFQDSQKDYQMVSEREARDILDQRAGYRIKYDYIGAAEDTEYKRKRQEIINEANTKYKPLNQLDDEMIITNRKFIKESLKETEDVLIASADPTKKPREFKVLKFNMTGSDVVVEETNPIFRGMIR